MKIQEKADDCSERAPAVLAPAISEFKKGDRMTFSEASLPFGKRAGAKKKTGENRARLPMRILMIEDDEDFAAALSGAINRSGISEVFVAADSFEAGNLMSMHAFDLVILDWRLPSLNGFTALRKAEQSLSLDPTAPSEWFAGKKVPVVVVTVCDSSEIERERRLKGCFQFLGVVSKEQPVEGILAQIQLLYQNAPLAPTG